jgi:CHASE3 domain sensor protein
MSTLPSNLQSALNAFKTNYAAYKVTGNTAYKTAYESAQRIIDSIIGEAESTATKNDEYLQGFIDSYETTNHEIVDLHNKSKKIRKEGPEIQDKLAQSRQLHQHEIAAVNDTGLYIKSGIVVALVVIVGIVGAL